jgi:hypothetical protein
MRVPDVFNEETRVTTNRNLDRFAPIKDVMRSVAGAEDFTLLCSGLGEHISASAVSSYRIVVLSERLMRAPENVIAAVAVHEAVHLRIGSGLAARLAKRHPDVTLLMYGVVLPDWLLGRASISFDDDYINSKGWRSLYDAWVGPLDIEGAKAARAVEDYFEVMKQGGLLLKGGELLSLPLLAVRERPRPLPALKLVYDSDPNDTIVKIATGYEMIEYFYGCLQAASSDRLKADVCTLEEAFANYIASGLTGTSLDELQLWASQDDIKIRIARQMLRSGPAAKAALSEVKDHAELVTFGRRIGVLR